MEKVLVEVCFQDKLQSIRVDQRQMEIPNSIKVKSVREWFEPATGRVKWAGLAMEIQEMNCSDAENSKFVFQFSGPEAEKQEFMACVRQYHLGEEAKPESVTEKAQDYLSKAESYHNAGNEIMAFQNYEIAAEEYGLPEAQFELGNCYQNGFGTEKDENAAAKWYEEAAKQEYAEAQFQLACCYSNGKGVEQDLVRAADWCQKAAEQGCADAQYRLAEYYSYGNGVEKSEEEATKWYQKAAAQGQKEALQVLECQKELEEKERQRKAEEEARELECQKELEEEHRRIEEEAKELEQNEYIQTKDNDSGQKKEKAGLIATVKNALTLDNVEKTATRVLETPIKKEADDGVVGMLVAAKVVAGTVLFGTAIIKSTKEVDNIKIDYSDFD